MALFRGMTIRKMTLSFVTIVMIAIQKCLSLYSVDSLRALICYCFVNYCLLY